MSTATISTSEHASAAGEVAATHTAGDPVVDPLVLGLPLISVAAVALGLQEVGFVNVASLGSPLAIILGASGLGLFLTAVAAFGLERNPVSSPWQNGSSLPTLVLGVLSLFFISYAVLVLGATHGWFGIQPADLKKTIESFQISWLVVFAFGVLASTRLPVLFTVLFAAFVLTLVLLLLGTANASTTWDNIAGVVILVIAVAAGYVFLAVASVASGGREYPLGAPLAR